MPQDNEIKKIERRAKSLLLKKNIPAPKMEIVRSLLKNEKINPAEKYRAIIDLIESCPDKPVKIYEEKKVEVRGTQQKTKKLDVAQEKPKKVEPLRSGALINSLYRKYKKYKFFKKRYLAYSNNRFGFGIRKRLVPTKRLLRALKDIYSFQEKILTRLPEIQIEILRDEDIQDPTHFNYLRLFNKWMMETPLVQYNVQALRWMDSRSFESELKDYIINFLSFYLMDTGTREQILLLAENKLRGLKDIAKEIINEKDPEQLKREKEKKNLKREKIVYDYVMLLRSFLPSDESISDPLSRLLEQNYSIEYFLQFLTMLVETLVFKREINHKDIIEYYNITPPAVSFRVWDYSLEELKKLGKDPETIIKRHIERLKKELNQYEEIYSFLKYELNSSNLLLRIFETQLKYIDHKKGEALTIYNEDFFSFIEGCLVFFNNYLAPFLDGSNIVMEDKKGNFIDGSIFYEGYFEKEIHLLSNTLKDIYYLKTENVILSISRDEAVKILNGDVRSMSNVETFLRTIGSLFYDLGNELKRLMNSHKNWVFYGSKLNSQEDIRTPLFSRELDEFYIKTGRPIPFYDCRIKGFQERPVLSKLFSGREIMCDTVNDSIIYIITAFSYQIAYECDNENVNLELEERNNLIQKIKQLES